MGNQQSGSQQHHNKPKPASQQQKPQMISGRPTPKYIRSITVQNRTNKNLRIVTKHKSLQTTVTDIGAGSSQAIQKILQGDGFTTVDPIVSFLFQDFNSSVILQGDDSDAARVQARHYIVQATKVSRVK